MMVSYSIVEGGGNFREGAIYTAIGVVPSTLRRGTPAWSSGQSRALVAVQARLSMVHRDAYGLPTTMDTTRCRRKGGTGSVMKPTYNCRQSFVDGVTPR